jgi:Pectate lyase superfamily protein
MAVALSETPILQFWNNAGQLNVGGSLLTQVGGVNYPTYQDPAGLTALPNPIPLNSRGEISNSSGVSSQLYLLPGVVYVFTLYDCFGNQLWVAEDVMGIAPVAVGALTDENGSNGQPGFSAANGDFTPGTTTTLTLSKNYGSASNLWVAFDGVEQGANTFSLSGTTLTFNAPIPVGTSFVFVKGGTTLSIGTPSSGTVTDSSVANNANINSSKIGFLQAGAGAVNRTVLSKLQEVQLSVKDFGATGNGTTDDTTSINSAIAAISNLGGGVVYFPPGTYLCGELQITSSSVKLRGAGHGGFHFLSPYRIAPSQLVYNGVNVTGSWINFRATSNFVLDDCELTGIYLNPGSGNAPINVVNVVSCCFSKFEVVTDGQTGVALLTGCSNTVTETPDTQRNEFWVTSNCAASGTIVQVDGISTANTSFNTFHLVDGDYTNGNGINIDNADNNLFMLVRMFREAGGTGLGVAFGGTNVANTEARNNIFIDLSPGDGGVYSQGTSDGFTYPAINNFALFYDSSNTGSIPNHGAGATFYYGTTQTPIGIRSQTLQNISSGYSTIVYSDGRTKISGQTSTLTGSGGTQTITLPTTPSIGVLSAKLTPIGIANATACVNPPSGNTVVVVCGTASSGFFFEIEYI